VAVLHELLASRFAQGLAMTLLGIVTGWLLGRWRRHQLLRQVRSGSAREVVAIEQVLVRECPDGRATLRIRSCGSAPLRLVLPNPVAQEAFLERAGATTPSNPLISMKDTMGSYLLYLLTPWVCGMIRGGPFSHDAWVMAPVCEPGLLSAHQSITAVLVRQSDLRRFLDWPWCRRLYVEHGSDGARVLTLWHLAREFEVQLAEVRRLREAGKPSTSAETMYILDLGLDTEEVGLPTKPVPWDRFAPILNELGLSAAPGGGQLFSAGADTRSAHQGPESSVPTGKT
jgi:hypothetical protein